MTPCIVITRDRVSYTRRCLASLTAGIYDLDIHIVDHGSTWEEMQPLLDGGAWPVHRRGDQTPRSLWDWTGLADIVDDRPYLVTDPDVVLDDDCPGDWLDQLHRTLNRHNDLAKVGLGLRIDDLPATTLGAKVREWEQAFWMSRLDVDAFSAPVDTTLALYPPLSCRPAPSRGPRFGLVPAARLDAPYLLRHLPWYEDLDPGETAYYRAHAIPGTSHWINGGW